MFSSDIQIVNKKQNYYLLYEDQLIKCSDTDDYVKDNNYDFLSFILEDLDRCGELKINKNSQLRVDSKIGCAYYIYSAQKAFIENKKQFDDLCKDFSVFPTYDYSLIQVANGPPLELEEIKRLLPVRNAIEQKLGTAQFKKITEYAWGGYYARNFNNDHNNSIEDFTETCVGGTFISDDTFSKTELSKSILKLFLDSSQKSKAAILTLFHRLERRSLLLPLAFINKWINKREFISGAMVLGGSILDIAGAYGKNSEHHEVYNNFDLLGSLCLTYSEFEDHPVLQLIKKGEGKKTEFKESLSLDIRRSETSDYIPKKEKYIELAVLKTIAGFLNSEGGNLLIGVDDNGHIKGIENEIKIFHKESQDKIHLHLKNLIKKNIGSGFSSLINSEILAINGLNIIQVSCQKSDEEVFIQEDFYIRTGPSTDKLVGKELTQYTKKRFK